MKEPKKIKLTDAPSAIDVNKKLLAPINKIYDDFGYLFAIEIKNILDNEDNSKNNSESIQ